MARKKIRIAIVGVGNCASSLIQGIDYYKGKKKKDIATGVMHYEIGGYKISDIEVVAAFDVNKKKVGKDISKAVFAEPNNTVKFQELESKGVEVLPGKLLDGMDSSYMGKEIEVTDEEPADVAKVLKDKNVDVLIDYLPVGSEGAVKYYAECCLEAGVGMINAMPVFIASDETWEKRFRDKGIPIIGDDVKSQIGATILHRVLANIFDKRGVKLENTSQLNVGGNMDFLNMLDQSRLGTKRKSKTQSVQSQLRTALDKKNIHIGPSDYIDFLDDRKWMYLYMDGKIFGDIPIRLDMKLEVVDSPNSAGVVIDAIRLLKLALDNNIRGALIGPSSFFMKSPPKQFTDAEAEQQVEDFIGKYG